MNVLVQQSTAALGDEEVRAAAQFKISIAPFGVAAESRTGRWMQGNEARLAELGLSNRQYAFLQVDVATLEAYRLGQTHARDRDRPEQAMVGPSAQSAGWRQGQRRRQQRVDLCIAVDIRLRTLQARQDAGRRRLRQRIDVRDVTCKTTHVGQPQSPGSVSIGWQGRPRHSQLRGDARGFARLHERDEIREPSRLVLVLVPEPLAHAQISLKCGSQIGHCMPPGHGRLNDRSASISTFA